MKKISLLLALLMSFAILSPTTSEARDHHRGSLRVDRHCNYCGRPVYQERVYSGRHGRPAWRTIHHYHRVSTSYHHRGHRHGHRR